MDHDELSTAAHATDYHHGLVNSNNETVGISDAHVGDFILTRADRMYEIREIGRDGTLRIGPNMQIMHPAGIVSIFKRREDVPVVTAEQIEQRRQANEQIMAKNQLAAHEAAQNLHAELLKANAEQHRTDPIFVPGKSTVL